VKALTHTKGRSCSSPRSLVLRSIATRILELEPGKKPHVYGGPYDEYVTTTGREAAGCARSKVNEKRPDTRRCRAARRGASKLRRLVAAAAEGADDHREARERRRSMLVPGAACSRPTASTRASEPGWRSRPAWTVRCRRVSLAAGVVSVAAADVVVVVVVVGTAFDA